MSRHRLTVVLSQAPGKHPAKRSLEESLAAALITESGIDVSIVPNLYDLDAQHTGRLFLESVRGDMVVLSWLYPRAAFWLLDRCGIRGHQGVTMLKSHAAEEEDEESDASESASKGIGSAGQIPDRYIYTLDLRDANTAEPFVREIRRIAAECRERHERRQTEQAVAHLTMVQLGVPSLASILGSTSTNGNGPTQDANGSVPEATSGPAQAAFQPEELLKPTNRRWYPVIDYSRCTNCMECLDFCLFGVYGVDSLERIFVESQDNCKKGCPACSRVCPEQAIMFPEYKTPAIAGAPIGAISGLKIDLSKLFGGEAVDAITQAVSERDAELIKDGRAAVGTSVGLARRQPSQPNRPKDDLDKMIDDLDALGL